MYIKKKSNISENKEYINYRRLNFKYFLFLLHFELEICKFTCLPLGGERPHKTSTCSCITKKDDIDDIHELVALVVQKANFFPVIGRIAEVAINSSVMGLVSVTDTLLKKLESAQHSMEKKILGVSWRDRKTNSWVRTHTGCKDLTQTVKSSKWNWAGHFSRRTDDRWTTKSTMWITDRGGRKRGKPKRRWVDDMAKFDRDWVERAADREDWRSRREAFAQQSANMG
ncbi:hypothetical protein GQR58_001547 [Nymphon striatum]|nr:hypothetical protein GQR58_001547 [Nymphon striatum]